MNALFLQETPEDYVHSWSFFRDYYLRSLPPGVWYKEPYFESPPAHYRSVYDRKAFQFNAKVYPREFGKSILMREQILLDILTHPFQEQLVLKANDTFVKKDFIRLMWQLENNKRILEDFGCLRPRKGQGSWSTHMLVLSNGFSLIGQSIMAASSLGGRYSYIWMDDVEYDPLMKTAPTLLTENTKEYIQNHILPMLSFDDGITFQGTNLNCKLFIYKFTSATEEEIPELALWNTAVFGEVTETGDFLWPAKWDEEKLRLERVKLGEAAFQAQRMNRPGSGQDKALPMHDLLSHYSIAKPDQALYDNPLLSEAELVTWLPDIDEDGKEKFMEMRRPLGETVAKMQRFLVVDPKHTLGETTDFAAVMVIGIENSKIHKDTWYILDLYLERVVGTPLLNKIWELGRKWMVRLVGVEALGVQKQLFEQVASTLVDRSVETGWMPKPFPINYKGDLKRSKEDRIMILAPRFEQFRVKYPKHLITQRPWSDLYLQTTHFTPDGRSLQYDDAIDALAMMTYIVKPQGNYGARPVDKAPQTALELLEAGSLYIPGTKIPLLAALNASELTPDAIKGIFKAKRKQEKKQKNNRVRRHGHCVTLTGGRV